MGLFSSKANDNSDSGSGSGIVSTHRTGPDEVTTVIITSDGATSYPTTGASAFTEDEMLD
ncbi:hypothetical protein ACIP4W_41150 [Streptomyces sp. NPDC088846]|uniref:hypothetical protein n=1 Tax=Streptomyces sp. NPDC088846 TaxID=3365908 RepID=UPI0038273116